MIIDWSDEALDDLQSISVYISEESPIAAKKALGRIFELVETKLARHPAMGRPGRNSGTRELVVAGTSFILPYRVTDGVIEIIRVIHSSREWPESF